MFMWFDKPVNPKKLLKKKQNKNQTMAQITGKIFTVVFFVVNVCFCADHSDQGNRYRFPATDKTRQNCVYYY